MFFVVLSFSNGFTQNFADKKFYLIDSLDLTTLNKTDRQLIDSCLTLYHKTIEDTSKIKHIEFIVEECLDDKIWPKYNRWIYYISQGGTGVGVRLFYDFIKNY